MVPGLLSGLNHGLDQLLAQTQAAMSRTDVQTLHFGDVAIKRSHGDATCYLCTDKRDK